MGGAVIVIGLTGGIATGKGEVARAWATQCGVVVHDADAVAHALYQPGSPLVDALVAAFGQGILNAGGGIDRKALGRIVFDDEAARQYLNAIVHPAVRARYIELAAEASAAGALVFVIEAALMLDGEPDRAFFDAFVTTEVDEAEQLRRLMARDGLDEAQGKRRVRAQLPQAQRRARADYVLDTSGTPAQTQARALALLARLRAAHGAARG